VESHQRDRILAAVAQVAGSGGYANMSVEAIVTASGVSRRTFYDLYPSKEDAFLAACDMIVTELSRAVYLAYDATQSAVVRAERCLRAAIGYLVEHPDHAQVGIVEVLAAGAPAVERRDRALALLAQLVEDAAEELPEESRPSPTVSEAIIGGFYAVLYSRLRRGELDALEELVPSLLYSLLAPYLGTADALTVQQRVRERTEAA
jgi:AcrR family transcriptional regulator